MQPALTALDEEEKEPLQPDKRKRRLPLSFILGAIAILGAVIYLVFVNTQANAVYYMTVPELKSCKTCTTQSVRVEGIVQQGSIVHNDSNQLVGFVIAEGSQKLSVNYSGVVPDIFRPGADVVVEGRYTGQGPFQAQTLLTKCPSKFQAATPTP